MMKVLDNCRSKSSEPLRTDIDRLYQQLSKIPEDKIADDTTVQILLANISTLHACDIYRIIKQGGGTKKRKVAKQKEKGKRKRTVKILHYYL
jgi:maltooligosyltrehalose synthase